MKKKTLKKNIGKVLGFTLIELLVVVSIIGMLSSVTLASLSSTRIKARDTRRKEDIRQIQTALEMYYSDNGFYPSAGMANWVMSSAGSTCGQGYWGPTLGVLLAQYMKKLPVDPLGGLSCPWTPDSNSDISNYYNYAYFPRNGGKDYELVARLENAGDSRRCGRQCWLLRNNDGTVGPSWCAGDGGFLCSAPGTYSNRVYTGR